MSYRVELIPRILQISSHLPAKHFSVYNWLLLHIRTSCQASGDYVRAADKRLRIPRSNPTTPPVSNSAEVQNLGQQRYRRLLLSREGLACIQGLSLLLYCFFSIS